MAAPTPHATILNFQEVRPDDHPAEATSMALGRRRTLHVAPPGFRTKLVEVADEPRHRNHHPLRLRDGEVQSETGHGGRRFLGVMIGEVAPYANGVRGLG